jgi:TolA protein
MINDFKTALTVSILLHLTVFLVTSYKSKNIIYMNLPVELMFYNPPAPAQGPSQDVVAKEKDKEEIVMPKKEKKQNIKKLKEAKKQEVKEETTGDKTGSSQAAHFTPSNQISLESARFPYAYYTSMIVKKIGRNWQWAVEFGKLKAVIYFKVQKDGSLSAVSIKESSGDTMFDQQAIRAVKLSDPFPPLPEGYDENSLGVFFEFSFKE